MGIIKEVFRLNLVNSLLSIVIFFLFSPFIYYDNGIRCITVPCDNISIGSLLNYISLEGNQVYGISFSLLIAGLIISYLISAIIIYLTSMGFKKKVETKFVKKVKKKKRR